MFSIRAWAHDDTAESFCVCWACCECCNDFWLSKSRKCFSTCGQGVDSRPVKTRTLSTSTGRLNRRKTLDWTINLAKLRRLTILRTWLKALPSFPLQFSIWYGGLMTTSSITRMFFSCHLQSLILRVKPTVLKFIHSVPGTNNWYNCMCEITLLWCWGQYKLLTLERHGHSHFTYVLWMVWNSCWPSTETPALTAYACDNLSSFSARALFASCTNSKEKHSVTKIIWQIQWFKNNVRKYPFKQPNIGSFWSYLVKIKRC